MVHLRARIWLQAIREGKRSADEKQEITGSTEVARKKSRTGNVFTSSSLDRSFFFRDCNSRFSSARNKILLIHPGMTRAYRRAASLSLIVHSPPPLDAPSFINRTNSSLKLLSTYVSQIFIPNSNLITLIKRSSKNFFKHSWYIDLPSSFLSM